MRRFQHETLKCVLKYLEFGSGETNVCKLALMISVCSKQVWAKNEPEQWRGCSPQRGPRLQTGSLMVTYKTQTHSSDEWTSCHLHIKTHFTYLLSMMSTTEPSGLMKAEYSRSVSWLADTPTLWDPSHRNLLCKKRWFVWISLKCLLVIIEQVKYATQCEQRSRWDQVCYLKWAML